MKRKQLITNKSPILINISGTCGKTTTAKIIETVLNSLGFKVGLASSIGIYLNGKRVKKKDRTGPESFKFLHTRADNLDIIICENVLRHIKIDNFYPARADMCLITNVTEDHIHQTKSKTIKELAQIKSKLIDRCKDDGKVILNGDNKYTKSMAKSKKITKLILFTAKKANIKQLQKFHPLMIYYSHKRSIFKKQRDGKETKIIHNMAELPLTLDMKLNFNIYNLLSAISVLDNLSKIHPPHALLDKYLSKIKLDYAYIPGRFNIYDFKKFIVILDDAHNPESYKEAFRTAKQIKHKRLVSIIKASSTRTPDFITKLGEIAGGNSDLIYVKESFAKDSKKRRSLGGKIAKLLITGIQKSEFPSSNIHVILDEMEAVKTAIQNAKKDDLILVFGYRVDKLAKLISRLRESSTLQTSSNNV